MIVMNEEPLTWLKAIAYGATGSGKTSFGVTAPKPIFALTERNGKVHILDAAKRLGLPPPPVLLMETFEDYKMLLRAFRSPREAFKVQTEDGKVLLECERPETIVLDTATDAMQIVIADVHGESKPKKASDGLDDITRRHWNAYRTRGIQLLRWFRDAPAHTIFLCQRDERGGGEDSKEELQVMPSMPMRALTQFLTQSCSVVGITQRQYGAKEKGSDDKPIAYTVRTVAPDNYFTKPLRPLRDVEVPDFSSWVERTCAAKKVS